jgi:hypothetical protein
MIAQTRLSAYKQFASTTYSKADLSILHHSIEGKAEPMPLNASDYRAIFSSILEPTAMTSQAGNASIIALTYAMTWVHRVYGEIFTDQQSTLTSTLQNFATVPLQWGIVAKQLANYTVINHPEVADTLGPLDMPDDLATVAIGGKSTQRLAIQTWTGWVFIAADVIVLLLLLVGILCILRQPKPLPKSTGLAEIDTLIEAENITCVTRDTQIQFRELPQFVETDSTKDANYTEALRSWRMKYKGSPNERRIDVLHT